MPYNVLALQSIQQLYHFDLKMVQIKAVVNPKITQDIDEFVSSLK